MKRNLLKITAVVIALGLLASLLFGCKSAVLKLKDLLNLDSTPAADTTAAPSEETPSEAPDDTIPFIRNREVTVDYTVVDSSSLTGVEKEAADIIDRSICAAIAYVNTMKDSRHSDVSYPYDESVNQPLKDAGELKIYNDIVAKAYQGETYTIKAEETAVNLKKAYFSLSEAFLYGSDPFLESFLVLDATLHLPFGSDETVYDSLFSYFFDPYYDANVKVTDKTKILHDMELLKAVVKRVADYMPEGLSTYDRYYYLAAVLSEHVTYDDRPSSCFTAFGALVQGKAVCEGYSMAYLLLCREANLWCSERSGLPDGVGHAWNLIKLDSGIYNVDVTWCDVASPVTRRWYENFVKSDVDFQEDGHNPTTGLDATGTFEPNPYQSISGDN